MNEQDAFNEKILKMRGWTSAPLGGVIAYYDAEGRMHGSPPKYTRDVAAAWELVEEIRRAGRTVEIYLVPDPLMPEATYIKIYQYPDDYPIHLKYPTAAEAFARAWVWWKEQ